MPTFQLLCACLLVLSFIVPAKNEIATFLNFPNAVTDSNATIVLFYIHDWNTVTVQNGIVVKNIMLQTRPDVKMVVVVDWSKWSRSPDFYEHAQYCIPRVAQVVFKEMEEISSFEHIDPSLFECMGHGVGAHICGQVGKMWNNAQAQKKLGKIIGLNPTGPYFKDHVAERLSPEDATQVDAWHTDRRIGVYSDLGFNDVYPKTSKEIDICSELNPLKRHHCLHDAAVPIFLNNYLNPSTVTKEDHPQEHSVSMSILTLDLSPSMQNAHRIQNMLAASKRFINSLPNDYWLGLVVFGGEAHVAAQPSKITDDASRLQLASVLPPPEAQIPDTSIGSGIFKAAEVIDLTLGKGCPDIIVVTDGEENTKPSLSDVIPYVVPRCTRIHSIALGNEADPGLEAISKLTRGQTYFASDVTSLDKLTQSMLAASTSQFAPEQRPISLPPKPIYLDVPVSFVFDDDIGSDTTFAVSTPYADDIDAELTSPDGIVYTQGNYTVDPELHQLLFKVLQAEAGNWTMKLSPKGQPSRQKRQVPQKDSASPIGTVFVTTHASAGNNDSIRLDGSLSHNIFSYESQTPIAITAYLYKGNDSVIRAMVEADVSSSDGSIITLELLDNGAGADVTKEDGVYSRFVTSRLIPGTRYEVEVRARSAKDNTTSLRSANSDLFKLSEDDVTPLSYKFERHVSVGSFRVESQTNYVPLKPNPVTDLVVTKVDSQKLQITLEWTAAGNQGDNGTADTIQLQMFQNTNFSQGVPILEKDVVQGSLKPEASGEPQKVTIRLDTDTTLLKEPDLFFGIRTFSAQSGWSDLSNLASIEKERIDTNAELSAGAQLYQILIPLIALALILIGIVSFVVKQKLTHRKTEGRV